VRVRIILFQREQQRSAPLNIYFFIIAFFLFGLVFGSFLNVCIYRMPRELSVVSPRSACPACEAPIAGYDNIPVLSWIILGGKCRRCKAPISFRYAAVELLTGVFFVLSYLAASGYLPGIAMPGETVGDFNTLAQAIKLCVFSFLLLGLIFTDAETQLLPDLLTKPGIVLGIIFSLVVSLPGFAIPAINNWRVVSLINSLAGAILGAAVILGIALLYEAVRGVEGMGRGDVKLMALIGAFLGGMLTLLVLLMASVIGSFFGLFLILWVWFKRLARRRKWHSSEPAAVSRSRAWQSATLVVRSFPIPFGVFLGTAALFAVFWGNAFIRWYAQFYR